MINIFNKIASMSAILIGLVFTFNHSNVENFSSNSNNTNSAVTQDYGSFSIMSYNLRYKSDADSAFPDGAVVSNSIASRAPRVAYNVLKYLPDSFGVQEATSGDWIPRLEKLLYPTYEYVGFGREVNENGAPCGEASGIFYNRDRLRLIESGTRWFSNTPESPQTMYSISRFKMIDDVSKLNDELGTMDNCYRIFTYAIFNRISDNKIYMHMNSHYDLGTGANIQNAIDEMNFANRYNKSMPVLLTADYNAVYGAPEYDPEGPYLYPCQGVNTLIDTYHCISASYDSPPTYPTSYYPGTEAKTPMTIDFILSTRDDVEFESYNVITDLIKAGSDTHAGQTSDHYPIFATGHFKEPTEGYSGSYDPSSQPYGVDNSYVSYDANFNYIGTKSKYSNHFNLLAIDSTVSTNGTKVSEGVYAPYDAINLSDLSSSKAGTITYPFIADKAGKCDIIIHLARTRSRTAKLGSFAEIKTNGNAVDISNVLMPYQDTNQKYEWTEFVIKDIDLVKGKNTVSINRLQSPSVSLNAPNQLMLDVFSDINITKKI